jgi:hypothetical protein
MAGWTVGIFYDDGTAQPFLHGSQYGAIERSVGLRGAFVKDGDGKTRKVESFDSVLAYGAVFQGEEIPADLTDSLLAALAAWGDTSDDAENAMVACLYFADHADPRARAVAVSAIGKLIPKLGGPSAEAIAAVSRALSDSDGRVAESAERAAQLVRAQTGITIERSPA